MGYRKASATAPGVSQPSVNGAASLLLLFVTVIDSSAKEQPFRACMVRPLEVHGVTKKWGVFSEKEFEAS